MHNLNWFSFYIFEIRDMNIKNYLNIKYDSVTICIINSKFI